MVESEARLFGLRRRRLFLVGMPFSLRCEVRNTGTTPVPARPPAGWEWGMTVHVAWSDGRVTDFETNFAKQLEPGQSVECGPFRSAVVAPGFFYADLYYPYAEVRTDEKGNNMGEMSGGKNSATLRSGRARHEHDSNSLDSVDFSRRADCGPRRTLARVAPLKRRTRCRRG